MLRYILLLVLSTLLINQVSEVDGARILGIFPLPAPSHYILGHKLMKELALRGHEVTFISSFEQKHPIKNYKDISLKGFLDKMDVFKDKIIEANEKSPFNSFLFFLKMTNWVTETTLNFTQTKELLDSNEKFDLVIMESFLNEAHVIFAHRFEAPLVVVSTIGPNFFINNFVKNPSPVSYCPQVLLGAPGRMNFAQRLMNTLLTGFITTIINVFHYPNQNALVQKNFPGAPSVEDIINEKLSLVLLNSHSSLSPAVPTVPNMIEIGGFHVEEAKELPKDLKDNLDNAKDGFILFSMGSNLKSTMLPEEKRNILMSVFKELPYKILWKFEDKNLPGKPENVQIEKWLPQNDVLAHPNLKLFITHGGLLSTTEAIYHGVPIVGIPVFGDQKMNMENAKGLGIGTTVEFNTLNRNDLWNAIQTVLNDKSYRENVQERSKLLRDRPMKPIDTAMYWIEYALRHKTNSHMKTNAIHLKWWELYNLDVIALLGTVFLVFVYGFYWIIRKLCCSKSKTNHQQQIKKIKKKQ